MWGLKLLWKVVQVILIVYISIAFMGALSGIFIHGH
jgi:hypothetical protein